MNTAIMNEKMAHAFVSAILSAHERMHERDINAMLSIFKYYTAHPALMEELAERNEFADGCTGEIIENITAGAMPVATNPSDFLEDMCYIYAIEMAMHR